VIPDHLVVAGRIRGEIGDLGVVVIRAREALHRSAQSNDQLYLDAAALNLHSYYSGIEHLFELIAGSVDGTVPHGERWHQDLLRQMAVPIRNVRDAVISPATRDMVSEYLAFRHVVRNVYSFHLDAERVARLVRLLDDVHPAMVRELQAFAAHLEAVSAEDDRTT
jgi:hypothetical protein